MARPRKPTALKLIHGSRDRHKNKLEPKPEGIASMPSWLSKDGRKEWRRLAPELTKIGILTIADETEFAVYCQAYAELKEAEAELASNGPKINSTPASIALFAATAAPGTVPFVSNGKMMKF